MFEEDMMIFGISKEKAKAARILVADDDPDILRLVSKILRQNGHEVMTANDGLECIAKAEDELPDLILLDNSMPNMDGQEALVRLKRLKKTEKIPVIMVTAFEDEQNLAGARKGGALQYIVKPFDCHVLIEKVSQVLKSKRK